MTDIDRATTRQQKKEQREAKRQARIDAMNAKMDARIAKSKDRAAEHAQRAEELKAQAAERQEKTAAEQDARKSEREAANEELKAKYAARKADIDTKHESRSKAARHPLKYMGRLGSHFLSNGEYSSGLTKIPIAGATAEYESGAGKKRVTGTRVITGAVLLGPVGAVAGGALRKTKTKCYVTITFADGNVVIIESPIKDEPKARKFAATVNAASVYYADRD